MMTAAEKGEVLRQLYLQDVELKELAYETGYPYITIRRAMGEYSLPKVTKAIFDYLRIDANSITAEPQLCKCSRELAAEAKKQQCIREINCTELAKLIGTSRPTVSAFFRRDASFNVEYSIAKALRIPITNPFYHEVRTDEIYNAESGNARRRI